MLAVDPVLRSVRLQQGSVAIMSFRKRWKYAKSKA